MGERTKLAVGALGAALVLGILGDGLFRVWPWGINVGVWTVVALLAVAGVAWWARLPLVGGGRWLAIPALFFALALAWRDSEVLAGLNVLALLTCFTLAALYTRAGRIRTAGVVQNTIGGIWVGIVAAVGSLLLLVGDVDWRTFRGPRGWGTTLAVVRGLVLAIPVLLVFGGLLLAADAAFAGLVSRLFHWDLTDLAFHLIVVGLIAWPVAGVLRQLLLGDEWADPLARQTPFVRLGPIEVGIVLGTLDLLFFAFVLVQLRYFFGGADLVETSATLTYSEYARRGFFELVYVALFALPLLLGIHWMIPPDGPRQQRGFQVLAGVMIALLFVIMISALQRMRLYSDEFGLTELRLYPTAFMGWLALVFLWFAVTVLRGQRRLFAFGALVAAFGVLALLNALSPDDLIAWVNLGRGPGLAESTTPRRGPTERPVDWSYLSNLSADAVPTLVARLETLPPESRPAVAAALLRRWTPPSQTDWRTANWGRARAWEAVAGNQDALRALAASAPAGRTS